MDRWAAGCTQSQQPHSCVALTRTSPPSLPHLLPPFADQFIELKTVFDWLETKRTNMKLATGVEAKLGHMPQEDYADAIILPICKFLEESWLAA